MMDAKQYQQALKDRPHRKKNLRLLSKVLLDPRNAPYVFGAVEARLEKLKEHPVWRECGASGKSIPIVIRNNDVFRFALTEFDAVQNADTKRKFAEFFFEEYPEGPAKQALLSKYKNFPSEEELAERLLAFRNDFGKFQITGISPRNKGEPQGIMITISPNPLPVEFNDFGFALQTSSTDAIKVFHFPTPIPRTLPHPDPCDNVPKGKKGLRRRLRDAAELLLLPEAKPYIYNVLQPDLMKMQATPEWQALTRQGGIYSMQYTGTQMLDLTWHQVFGVIKTLAIKQRIETAANSSEAPKPDEGWVRQVAAFPSPNELERRYENFERNVGSLQVYGVTKSNYRENSDGVMIVVRVRPQQTPAPQG